ncbi:hypothetical protein Syun_024803 [Stephania yunnanensis]|uniref:CCT domain-containing protein n=1 Tax=Stephania yunnanensis TaxID=152371 RepID=A0AAP0EW44_9MAGN
MSSCLSGGGGRTYGFDLEIVKSQSNNTATRSTSTASHSSSSQSSTVSESINSPLSISTRKPRTPRKRPHQTYNEAAALLSTVYPNIFSTKTLSKSSLNPSKTPNNSNNNNNNTELSEFLPPSPVFDNTEFLIKQQEEVPRSNFFSKTAPIEVSGDFKTAPIDSNSSHGFDEADDFDAESILDEEMEEGIDSIMGNLSVNNSNDDGDAPVEELSKHTQFTNNSFNWSFAFRRADDCDYWWRFPTVDVLQISPKFNNNNGSSSSNNNNNAKSSKTKKKKKKLDSIDRGVEEQRMLSNGYSNLGNLSSNSSSNSTTSSPSSTTTLSGLLSLKLNYDDVLSAWSGRGSPFSEEIDLSDSDAIARLVQMELVLGENGGIREASVMRYREKRRSRLFSKKIRYQVRKVNADRRPRMKARPIC